MSDVSDKDVLQFLKGTGRNKQVNKNSQAWKEAAEWINKVDGVDFAIGAYNRREVEIQRFIRETNGTRAEALYYYSEANHNWSGAYRKFMEAQEAALEAAAAVQEDPASGTASGETSGRTASGTASGETKSGTPSPLPFNSKKYGQFGEHFLPTKKSDYTSVELATTFCPGINLTSTEASRLFGHTDFLQILQQYNALKDKIFRGGEQFTDCDNRNNIDILVNKLNGQSVGLQIFYLLNYLEFLLNCLRQLIIKFKVGADDGKKVVIKEFFKVSEKLNDIQFGEELEAEEEEKNTTPSSSDKKRSVFSVRAEKTFESYLKKKNNYGELVKRLKTNFEKLIVSINEAERARPAGSDVGKTQGETKSKKVDKHDYSKISGTDDLQKYETGKNKGPNPSGHANYRLEWLLKTFMNNTINLWCEENHSKIIEYIRKLKVKNHDAANKAALEFLTKLMILLLQDINRVSSDRLVNNKFLLSLFARSSLCSLLAKPDASKKRGTSNRSFHDVFSSEKLQKNPIEKIKGMAGRALRSGIDKFGKHTISKHLQEGLIFSPLDYYIAIIESQAGGFSDELAEPTFSAHLKEFGDFIKKDKSFCYGSSYTKMFSMKLDEGMNGVRGEFDFKPLWDIGEKEELTGGMNWFSGASTVGLSRGGNLSIIKTGEQTAKGSERMRFIANILTESLGYTSALLCLGLSDIGSIAFKAATEEWDSDKSMERLRKQVKSIDVWRQIVGTECKLIYLLLPPVPWQDPREVFNGLWANQFNSALGKVDITSFLNKSDQIIDVCKKIADRTYYDKYRVLWQEKQNEGFAARGGTKFDLWCLTTNGISKLQTCRAYNLQNIHYDYNLLRNLYFTDGELFDVGEAEQRRGDPIRNKNKIQTALKNQYLYIEKKEIEHIRKLSLHKYATVKQKKYWLLDAQAQLFKENFAKKRQGDSMKSFVKSYHECDVAMIKDILDVDSNLIKKEEDNGIQRLVGDKLTAVFQGFNPLTAKNDKAKGPFAARLKEIWTKVSNEEETRDNTFKFLEHVMINITRAVEKLPQKVDNDQKRLLNYERTAVVLLLDNLVGLSFFRMDSSIKEETKDFLQKYFYASGDEEGFALPWTSLRIPAGFYIGSRRFNEQFIFDYCIGELIGVVEELRKKYLKKKSQGAEELLQNKESDLMACCEYQNGDFVRRYVALLPTQETPSLQSIAPPMLRTGSQDTDIEELERRKAAKDIKKLLNIKNKTPQQNERLIYLQENVKRRDAFVSQHYEVTSPRSQDESDKSKKTGKKKTGKKNTGKKNTGKKNTGKKKTGRRGGKRTRKRRKSKKPRKTKSKRFRKKKKHTRKRRYKKKRRKTRR